MITINEIESLAKSKFLELDTAIATLWGSASAILTQEQLSVIKSTLENGY